MRKLNTLETLVISTVVAGSIFGVLRSEHPLSDIQDHTFGGSVIAYVDPSYFLSSSSSSRASSVQRTPSVCGEGVVVGQTVTLQELCMACVCTSAGMACTRMQTCTVSTHPSASSAPAENLEEDEIQDEEFMDEPDSIDEFEDPIADEESSEEMLDIIDMLDTVDIPTFPTELPDQHSSAALQRFSDVSELTSEGVAASALAGLGVITGFPDGRFRPELPVNRAEAAKMILLARFGPNSVSDMNTVNHFVDVPNTEWYAPYVLYASSQGIISGYPDRTFKAGHLVNTAEFLKMITIAFNLKENNLHSYQDVPFNSWFYRYAGTASVYNLFPDRPFLRLQPERYLTRGEVAVALHKLLQR